MKKIFLSSTVLSMIAVGVFIFVNSNKVKIEGSVSSDINATVSTNLTSNTTPVKEESSPKKEEKISKYEIKKRIKVVFANEQMSEGKSKLEIFFEGLSGDKKRYFQGIMPFEGKSLYEIKPLSFYKDIKNHPHVLCVEEGAGRFAYVMDLELDKTFFYDWKVQKVIYFTEKITKKIIERDTVKFISKAERNDLKVIYSFETVVSAVSYVGSGTLNYSMLGSSKEKSWSFECELID